MIFFDTVIMAELKIGQLKTHFWNFNELTTNFFLGEIFNEMSGNYYHYEPLMDFEIRQVRQGFDVERALYQLSDLFDCNYRVLEQFVDYARHHDYVFTHNTRLWAACNRNNLSTLCYNDDFLSDFCAIHPYQSMKLVRLRLNLIEPLIKK